MVAVDRSDEAEINEVLGILDPRQIAALKGLIAEQAGKSLDDAQLDHVLRFAVSSALTSGASSIETFRQEHRNFAVAQIKSRIEGMGERAIAAAASRAPASPGAGRFGGS